MCGMIGCASAILTPKHEQAFKDLLVVDTIRGPHSTGIMAASNDVSIFKKALLPSDLFTMSGCKSLFTKQNHALIGHNRWATKGAINGINAHPFEFDTLVGCANGTLNNQSLLPDHQDFDVDSENIFHSFEKIGVKETVAKLNGSYALSWYNKANRSINFIRNKERPLFLAFTENDNTLFWASEAWMLSGILGIHGIEHKEIFDTSIHHHYEFKIPVGKMGDDDSFVFPAFSKEYIEPWVAPPIPKRKGWNPNAYGGNYMKRNGATTTVNKKDLNSGWEYEMGDMSYFFLDPDSPKDERYILGKICHNTTKAIKIYTKRGSWLRGNLECDDVDYVAYRGIVNGYSSTGELLVQENSVYTVATEEVSENDPDIVQTTINEAKDMSPGHRGDQIIALGTTGGTCSWCGDPITPHKEHVYVDNKTIICRGCKDDETVKDFIGNS